MIELVDIEKVFQTKTIETVALKEIRLNVKKGEVVYDGASPSKLGDETS